jgi:hypothetical protein
VARIVVPVVTTPTWYDGCGSSALGPPVLPLQPVSLPQPPLLFSVSDVPPTPRTFGEAAGHSAGAPLSPEATTNATPGALK